jgi:hypothetical protein
MTSGSSHTSITMFSAFSRANGRLPSTRIAILLSLVAMALLLGQLNSFGETLDNVSNTSTVVALQKAIQDGQALVTSYAGSAASAAGLYGSSSPENKGPALSKEKAAKLNAKRYIVLPATAPNPGFCRTLFALLINEYGAPTIVSWCFCTAVHDHITNAAFFLTSLLYHSYAGQLGRNCWNQSLR